MTLDEIKISKAIAGSYMKDLIDSMESDIAIIGAGPSGMAAGYYLAKEGLRVVIFEKDVCIGGGIWGGGMMFTRVVVQEEGKLILDEFGVETKEYEKGYYIANSLEIASTICSKTMEAGARIFNLIFAEDVMIRDSRVTGLVLNWTATERAHLHVDPLAIRSKVIIDATGHNAEVCSIVEKKVAPELKLKTGGSMWAEVGEKYVIENTKEVYPGLIAAGMATSTIFGTPRMGPIFGGMLLSGKKAAEIALESIR